MLSLSYKPLLVVFLAFSSVLFLVNGCKNEEEDAGRTALIVVDMQNDFLPATSEYQSRLPVAGGDAIIPNINRLLHSASKGVAFDVTVVTQDYHPQDHISFWTTHAKVDENITADNIGTLYHFHDINGEPREQVLWPPHCVVGATDEYTKGVEITEELIFDRSSVRWVRKGHDLLRDSYSAFLDNDGLTKTGLGRYLVYEENVSNVVIVGLAADFCVKYSAVDALVQEDLNVYIPLDATAAVFPDTWAEEQAELKNLGIVFGTTNELLTGGWKFSADCPEQSASFPSTAASFVVQSTLITLFGSLVVGLFVGAI